MLKQILAIALFIVILIAPSVIADEEGVPDENATNTSIVTSPLPDATPQQSNSNLQAVPNNINTILSSDQLTLIVLISIAACLACIYAVFFFGRRVQENSALRGILVDGMKQQEYYKLYEELYKKAIEGALDPENHPLPPGYDKYRLISIHPNIKGEKAPLYRTEVSEVIDKNNWIEKIDWAEKRSFDSPEHEIKWKEEQKEEQKRLKEEEEKRRAEFKEIELSFLKWENEETIIFETKRKEIEEKALQIAEKKVPKTMDISLLGGGFSFLLEFSTVIVIIFTLLILGVIGSLGGNEISTILASIAGYVLGKATSAGKEGTSEK
jgi:hypothetical protein